MKKLVIYHGGSCADGFCSAWLFARSFPDAEFLPAQYGEPAPDVTGKEVFVLDFSYKRDVLAEMCRKAEFVTLLDHHLTAQQDLESVARELSTVRSVPLGGGGGVAYVDEADVEKVSGYSWCAAKHGGAMAYAGGGRAEQRCVYMHRLITDAPDGVLVDHRNRNPLDNRRSNLRFATRQQNAANMDRGSKWKGVRVHHSRWVAQITVTGENRHIGVYDTPEEAAAAYDAAAREHFGEFARCNFGESSEPFPANCRIVFDTGKSGGRLAWDWLEAAGSLPPSLTDHYGFDSPPWLVRYTEARDLWRFDLPYSHEVSAAIRSYPMDFDLWDRLEEVLRDDPDNLRGMRHDVPADAAKREGR